MGTTLAADLMKDHTVVVPDLRGIGKSSRPDGRYDKKTQAQHQHQFGLPPTRLNRSGVLLGVSNPAGYRGAVERARMRSVKITRGFDNINP
jgi:hypothetical protein